MRWDDLLVMGDDRRREIRARHKNGVDGVEVSEGGRRLTVLFLEHVPEGLSRHNIRIDGQGGARRVHAVSVRRSSGEDPELEDRLIVELDHPGSAGRYHLRVVEPGPNGRPGREPHRGIDPRFAQAGFVFDVDAPLPAIRRRPPSSPPPEEEVSYLGRDYEGLRQLMLDRLAVTLPGFTERHIPDILITLVEALAYVGDDLSYYEDAVATEAYLQTARRRISVRRHARLLGYRLHSGNSARAWVGVSVSRQLDLPLTEIRFAAAGALADGTPLLDATALPEGLLSTLEQYSPLPAVPSLASRTEGSASSSKPGPVTLSLRREHNEILLWSWGEADSRLVIGATSAVLVDGTATGRTLALSPGDVLILEEAGEVDSPLPSEERPKAPPSDPAHRQAVRLTAVRELTDELYDQPLVEVHWAPEDALTFELPVRIAGERASHALGNVVLVAHGAEVPESVVLDDTGASALTQPGVSFSPPFPDAELVGLHQARVLRGLYRAWRAGIERHRDAAACGTALSKRALDELRRQLGQDELKRLGIEGENKDDADRAECEARGLAELLAQADRLLARRRRRLETLAALARASGALESVLIDELTEDWGAKLTAPLAPSTPGGWGPAASATALDPRNALPVAVLSDASGIWEPAVDLIGVNPTERAFVAELDDEGIAHLRVSGASPGSTLQATYWVGNGAAGNVVAEAIDAIVWIGDSESGAARPAPGIGALTAVTAVRNPLPASGGVDPEDSAGARLAIPGSFEDRQPRALTSQDYEQLAARLPGVRRAAAELRFTGALVVADVAVQPTLGEDPHPALLASVEGALEQVRRIGHVVRVYAPRYRPLIIGLEVTLAPNTVRATAATELAALLSDGWLRAGRPALFNPEQVGFGQSVFASAIIAGAQGVDGVESVTLKRFSFVDDPVSSPPAVLHVARMEMVRLDNDPAHPQNGYAIVSLEGGR